MDLWQISLGKKGYSRRNSCLLHNWCYVNFNIFRVRSHLGITSHSLIIYMRDAGLSACNGFREWLG